MWSRASRMMLRPAYCQHYSTPLTLLRPACSTRACRRVMRMHARDGDASMDHVLQRLYADAQAPAELNSGAELPLASATPASLMTVIQQPASVPMRQTQHASSTADTSVMAPAPNQPHPSAWTQAAPNKQELKNPSRLPFEPMYQQLVVWRMAHLSCHVPRNCFDAPPMLDTWVRHLRRLHESGKLERWKQDRLNMIGFEWEMSDVEAKWVNMYHQLRRFKVVHGHTDVPENYKNPDEPGWEILARWLRRQGQLVAQRKLTEQQEAMLRNVGVTLRVDEAYMERHVRLVGLNAHERKEERRSVRNELRAQNAASSSPGTSSSTADSKHQGAASPRDTPAPGSTPAAGLRAPAASRKRDFSSVPEDSPITDAALKKARSRKPVASDERSSGPKSAQLAPGTSGLDVVAGRPTDSDLRTPMGTAALPRGELLGGARATRAVRKPSSARSETAGDSEAEPAATKADAAAGGDAAWQLALVVTCPQFDRSRALSFEWFLKHGPSSRGGGGVARRLKLLRAALQHDKFKAMAGVRVYVCKADIADAVQQACAGTGAEVLHVGGS